MEAPAKKAKYCSCLYLEAGMHVIAVLTFANLGVSLVAMPAAMPFAIIYLVHCISFVLLAFFNDKIWNRLAFLAFYAASSIAEAAVGIVWTRRIYAEMTDADVERDAEFSRNFMIMAGACIGAWAVARIFALITLYKYFEDLRDGGVEKGKNLHSNQPAQQPAEPELPPDAGSLNRA